MRKLFQKFKKDISRIEGASIFRKMLNISFWIILIYRISNYFFYKNFFVVSKFFWLINRIVFSVDIDPGAKLEAGLKLVHPIGIVVGREVESKGRLTLYQNITLGGSNNKVFDYNGKIIKQPYILDNVIIYTSSVIIGPVIVGKNVIVAANSTITKNIPDNTICFGVNKFKKNG